MCRYDKTLSSLERQQQVSLFILLLTNIIISSPQLHAGIKKRLLLNATMAEILTQKSNKLAKIHQDLMEIVADF